MARKITPEQIKQMIVLYSELNSYTAVAKQLGVSAATVSRYIKQQAVEKTYSDVVALKPIADITKESILSFSTLTPAEEESLIAWRKEFGR